jgi:hypothetical protein
MHNFLRLGLVASLAVLLGACNASAADENAPPEQTFEAAREGAERTPIDDGLAEYVRQLCGPYRALLEDASELFAAIDMPPPSVTEDDVDEAIENLSELTVPLEHFLEAIREIEPPAGQAAYHEYAISEIAYAVQFFEQLADGGLFGALALETPVAALEEPAGFEAALLQECGDDLEDVISGLDDGFFADAEPTEEPSPEPISGEAGDTLSNGAVELLVDNLNIRSEPTPVPPSQGDNAAPPPALSIKRTWFVIDVSIKNVSTDVVMYSPLDFRAYDTHGSSWFPEEAGPHTAFLGQVEPLESGSLMPGESVHAQLLFVPLQGSLDSLSYEPNLGQGRIDVDLQ